MREPFLLRLFFARRLGPADITELLDARATASEQQFTALSPGTTKDPRDSRDRRSGMGGNVIDRGGLSHQTPSRWSYIKKLNFIRPASVAQPPVCLLRSQR